MYGVKREGEAGRGRRGRKLRCASWDLQLLDRGNLPHQHSRAIQGSLQKWVKEGQATTLVEAWPGGHTTKLGHYFIGTWKYCLGSFHAALRVQYCRPRTVHAEACTASRLVTRGILTLRMRRGFERSSTGIRVYRSKTPYKACLGPLPRLLLPSQNAGPGLPIAEAQNATAQFYE